MQPTLSLNFSSNGGNGLLGQGWSLSGMSAIQRCPRDKAHEGVAGTIEYNANDRFCMDGQRLIAVSGPYGEDGTEYRTELDSNSRIISHGLLASGGPTYFEVKTKAGLTMQLGNGNGSFLKAAGRSQVVIWSVNRISDSFGNYLTFKYFNDSVSNKFREFRVTQIDYTGNDSQGLSTYAKVLFDYQDRPDESKTYSAGNVTALNKRLTKIRTLVNNELVKEYRINYLTIAANWIVEVPASQGGGTQSLIPSRISKITECDATGVCLKPIEFTWETPSVGAENIVNVGAGAYGDFGIASERIRPVDIDVDGRTDLLLGPRGDGTWYWLKGTATGFQDKGALITNGYGNYAPKEAAPYVRIMDVTGDTRPDIVLGPRSDGAWFMMENKGTYFDDHGVWGDLAYGEFSTEASRIRQIDVNQDGRMDLLLGPKDINGGEWYWLEATATGFKKRGVWAHGYGKWAPPESQPYINTIDLNGDGAQDLLLGPTGPDSQGNANWYAMINTPTGFVDKGVWGIGYGNYSNSAEYIHFMDVTGDGMTDVVLGPQGSDGAWFAMINTGDALVDAGVWGYGYENYSTAARYITKQIDANGDGLLDLILGPTSAGKWFLMQSTGKSFINRGEWANGYGLYSNDDAIDYVRVMDFDGDGQMDFVIGPKGDHTWGELKNVGRTGTLLTKITVGNAIAAQISYKPMSDPTVYKKGSTDVPAPANSVDLQIPQQVVSQYLRDDGLGGTYRTTYFYEGMRVDTAGRGMLGFAKVTTVDAETDFTTVVQYNQTFPNIGEPALTEERTPNGKLVKSTSSETTRYNAGGVYKLLRSTVTENTYDGNSGAFMAETTTETQYDNLNPANGNATKIVSTVRQAGGATFTTTTDNVYTDNVAKWFLGRLTYSTVTKTGYGDQETRKSSFEYDNVTGVLTKESIAPDNNALALHTEYGYDAFGNKTTVTVSGADITTRSSTTIYDSRGRFAANVKNALNQEEIREHEGFFGNVTKIIDANSLATTYTYDTFGRLKSGKRPDGVTATKTYGWCQGDCPDGGWFYITEETTGAPSKVTYYDNVSRVIQVDVQGFGNKWTRQRTVYNHLGQVQKTSAPYYDYETVRWTVFAYDDLGRETKRTLPNGRVDTIAYSSFTTTKRVDLYGKNQDQVETHNAQGKLVKATDNIAQSISYQYTAYGDLAKTTDWDGNVISMTYDIRGRKTSMNDPDMGIWTYSYNTLGELLTQKDAKGNRIINTYDVLGRAKTRKDRAIQPGGTYVDTTTTWVYDTKAKGIGKLAYVTMTKNSYRYDLDYDAYGRVKKTTTSVLGGVYVVDTTYDTSGRPAVTTYPSAIVGLARFATRNVYDVAGYLSAVQQATTAEVYWEALEVNAEGKIKREAFGNGIESGRTFDELGRVTNIRAAVDITGIRPGIDAATQNLSYTYDNLGNVTKRTSVRPDSTNPAVALTLTEDFDYDNLNRLTQSTLGSGLVKSYSYYGSGNIKTKSDFGDTYVYGESSAGPHAVTTVKKTGATVATYEYDLNGSMTQRTQGGKTTTFKYTAFNMPSAITASGGDYSNFEYDHSRARMIQTANTGTTFYLNMSPTGGTLYEKEHRPAAGVTMHRHYLGNMIGAYVVEEYSTSRQVNRQYYLKDHLGSIDVVMNHFGDGVTNSENLSFDPFGKRRLATNWKESSNIVSSNTSRGFTGHEHLDELGLIHMNGRVYDPQLARFTSADPNIDGATSVQGFNRYTYVHNNPLSAADPTGFFKWSKFRDKWVKPIAAMAATFLLPPIIGSVVSTLIQGGDMRGALTSAFIGALTGGLGNYFEGLSQGASVTSAAFAARAVAQGVVSGAVSKLSGGNFGNGFKTGFVMTYMPVKDLIPGNSLGAVAARIATAAIVGGTASELGGGKFGNGAGSGAFESAKGEYDSRGAAGDPSDLEGLETAFAADESAFTGESYDDLAQANQLSLVQKRIADGGGGGGGGAIIKPGSAGGPTAGQRFPERVKDAAKKENPTRTCVYCKIEGTASQVDHAIPRARGGDATLDNAQLACPHCNASKGAGDFPKTPPPGYRGPWPY